jgi:hypothetical protein
LLRPAAQLKLAVEIAAPEQRRGGATPVPAL